MEKESLYAQVVAPSFCPFTFPQAAETIFEHIYFVENYFDAVLYEIPFPGSDTAPPRRLSRRGFGRCVMRSRSQGQAFMPSGTCTLLSYSKRALHRRSRNASFVTRIPASPSIWPVPLSVLTYFGISLFLQYEKDASRDDIKPIKNWEQIWAGLSQRQRRQENSDWCRRTRSSRVPQLDYLTSRGDKLSPTFTVPVWVAVCIQAMQSIVGYLLSH